MNFHKKSIKTLGDKKVALTGIDFQNWPWVLSVSAKFWEQVLMPIWNGCHTESLNIKLNWLFLYLTPYGNRIKNWLIDRV